MPALRGGLYTTPITVSLIIAAVWTEEEYACYAGGAAAGFSIALNWAPIGRAVNTIAQLFGWAVVANNSLLQCLCL